MTDLFELEPPVDEQAETESGPAHLRAPEPVSQLAKHFAFSVDAVKRADEFSQEETLLMGGIRTLYWLALGQGDTALARNIGDWWFENAQKYGLREVIA
ncbi:TPA: hypothetical protein JAJ28_000317 [Aeromonas hydrophila]|uniref:Uncharacterized protein n=1 Tax=Aeromonas hydrophila TaxID=644 RepID=A0AAD3U7I0_AERHY|nr:hypothetical protein [Aeromonas dhakensis]MBF8452018.1 hypothetical protein [Aeromonas dhakensis]HAT6342659.1 hypothetical protein [Aeromonas hydrophila]